jgi:hypothetical protein
MLQSFLQANRSDISVPRTDYNDRESVLEAVSRDVSVLADANLWLRIDPDFLREAISRNIHAVEYIPTNLWSDREYLSTLIALLKRDGNMRRQEHLLLEHGGQAIKEDRAFVLSIVKEDGQGLAFAAEPLKNDREIVLAAVTQKPSSLRFASESLKNDREIVLAAVRKNASALDFASESLRKDSEFISIAERENPAVPYYAKKRVSTI